MRRRTMWTHTVIDQSSVVKFIEENWDLPQIGNGSFDQIAGPIDNMFNWNKQNIGEGDSGSFDGAGY